MGEEGDDVNVRFLFDFDNNVVHFVGFSLIENNFDRIGWGYKFSDSVIDCCKGEFLCLKCLYKLTNTCLMKSSELIISLF